MVATFHAVWIPSSRESRKLKWGDISLIMDATTKNEVLLRTGERGSKTSHGESARAFNPTAQATSNERCPVKYYKSYTSHRPEERLKLGSPFFLAINHRRKAQSQIWYSKAPLGKNEKKLRNELFYQETSQTIRSGKLVYHASWMPKCQSTM